MIEYTDSRLIDKEEIINRGMEYLKQKSVKDTSRKLLKRNLKMNRVLYSKNRR